MRVKYKLLSISLLLLLSGGNHGGDAAGQAGRRTNASSSSKERGVIINVVAERLDGSTKRITGKDFALYDGGIEQAIQSFSPDPSPARIVLLVDNSLSLRADVEKLSRATREFAYEIYEGDQVLVVGYDENAEIISDWTDDAKKIEAALPQFRKRGEPHLFDALRAVINEALMPFADANRKRVIVLVADGLDRGSKTKFQEILEELQSQDITVYALQIPDRTGGAFRRDRPKPSQVIEKLVEGTGGRILTVNEPGEAAKSICDELRKNRYILAYQPTSYALTESRRLLLLPNEGIQSRSKLMIK
ncbi:MAG TPA: VWA domain-containing protein [Pyrinomonadaceae bacterium]|jgi:VWFA-related protein